MTVVTMLTMGTEEKALLALNMIDADTGLHTICEELNCTITDLIIYLHYNYGK